MAHGTKADPRRSVDGERRKTTHTKPPPQPLPRFVPRHPLPPPKNGASTAAVPISVCPIGNYPCRLPIIVIASKRTLQYRSMILPAHIQIPKPKSIWRGDCPLCVALGSRNAQILSDSVISAPSMRADVRTTC